MPDLSPHANCRFGRPSLPIPERSCSANGGVGWSFPHAPLAVGQSFSIGDREFPAGHPCPPRVHLSGAGAAAGVWGATEQIWVSGVKRLVWSSLPIVARHMG